MRSIRTGFTLIELIVVMALIGIVGLIATPAFTAYLDSSRLQFSQQVLETTLGQAFSHARSHPELVTVSGDAEAREIEIKYFKEDPDNPIKTSKQTLDRGVTLDANFSVTFSPPYGDILDDNSLLVQSEEGENNLIRLNGRKYYALTKIHPDSGLIETLSAKEDISTP